MASRIILGVANPSLDSNGHPVAGSQLTFYQNNTTTPQSVYTSSTLATPLANPLTCDAAGIFPPIWVADATGYSVKWSRPGFADVTFNDIFGAATNGNAIGTWTPELFGTSGAGSIGYGVQIGNYIKLGRQVFAYFQITTTSIAAMTGNVRIKNLPFSAAFDGHASIGAYNGVTFDAGYTQMTAIVPSGGTQIELIEDGSNKNSADIPAANVASVMLIRGVAVYEATF